MQNISESVIVYKWVQQLQDIKINCKLIIVSEDKTDKLNWRNEIKAICKMRWS